MDSTGDRVAGAERVVGGGAPSSRGRATALGALAAVGAAVVSAASSGLLARLGEAPGISLGSLLGDVVAVLLAATLLGYAALGYVGWVERALRRRGPEPVALEEEEPRRSLDRSALLLPLLFVSAVCLAIALAWLLGHPGSVETGRRVVPTPTATAPAPTGGGTGGRIPVDWLVFAVLSAVGGLAAAALLVRDRRRRRRERAPEAVEELAVAVEASLEELERERDARVAVIRAYGRMERALESHGTPRRPPETPLEYLARALAAVQASRGSIARLTTLFQRAKFSPHAIDAAMKHEAIGALRDLRSELDAAEEDGR